LESNKTCVRFMEAATWSCRSSKW